MMNMMNNGAGGWMMGGMWLSSILFSTTRLKPPALAG